MCRYSCDKGYYATSTGLLGNNCTSCATATGHSVATTATTGSIGITTCYYHQAHLFQTAPVPVYMTVTVTINHKKRGKCPVFYQINRKYYSASFNADSI